MKSVPSLGPTSGAGTSMWHLSLLPSTPLLPPPPPPLPTPLPQLQLLLLLWC